MSDTAKAGIPDCCQKAENLEKLNDVNTTNPKAFVYRCKVCWRRHYGIEVEPLSLGAKLFEKP